MSQPKAFDDSKLLNDFLSRENPLLQPVKGISRIGRTASPPKKHHALHRKPISQRETRHRHHHNFDTYDDGVDLRSLRLGAGLEETVAAAQNIRALGDTKQGTGAHGPASRGSLRASREGTTTRLVGGRVVYQSYINPGQTGGGGSPGKGRPSSVRLSSAASGEGDDFKSQYERPSTAKYSVAGSHKDPDNANRSLSARARSAGRKGGAAADRETTTAPFKAQGHGQGTTIVPAGVKDNPGPGHYTVKYTLREKRTHEAHMDWVPGMPAGRFAMTQINPTGSPERYANTSPRRSALQTATRDEFIRPLDEAEAAPRDARDSSPVEFDAEATGAAPLDGVPASGERSQENAASPLLSPTSPQNPKGFGRGSPTQDIPNLGGTRAFAGPGRPDPTDQALRGSAASHLVPYDVEAAVDLTRGKRPITTLAFDLQVSREDARRAAISWAARKNASAAEGAGIRVPPVGTYDAAPSDSIAQWRAVRLSVPRAAGSPVVALTRAGIRRAFAVISQENSWGSNGEGQAQAALHPEPAALDRSGAQGPQEKGMYRRKNHGPGRIEQQVRQTMERVAIMREAEARALAEAAAAEAALAAEAAALGQEEDSGHHLPPVLEAEGDAAAAPRPHSGSPKSPPRSPQRDRLHSPQSDRHSGNHGLGGAAPAPNFSVMGSAAKGPAKAGSLPSAPSPVPEEAAVSDAAAAAVEPEPPAIETAEESAGPVPAVEGQYADADASDPATAEAAVDAVDAVAADEPPGTPEAGVAPLSEDGREGSPAQYEEEGAEREVEEEEAAAEQEPEEAEVAEEDGEEPVAEPQDEEAPAEPKEEGDGQAAAVEDEAEEATQAPDSPGEDYPTGEAAEEAEPEGADEEAEHAPTYTEQEVQEEASPSAHIGSSEAALEALPSIPTTAPLEEHFDHEGPFFNSTSQAAADDSEALDIGELPPVNRSKNSKSSLGGRISGRNLLPSAQVEVTFPSLDAPLAQTPLTVDVAKIRRAYGADEWDNQVPKVILRRPQPTGPNTFAAPMVIPGAGPFHITRRGGGGGAATGRADNRTTQTALASHTHSSGHPLPGRYFNEALDLRDNLFPKENKGGAGSGVSKARTKPAVPEPKVYVPPMRLTAREHHEMQATAGDIRSTLKIFDPMADFLLPEKSSSRTVGFAPEEGQTPGLAAPSMRGSGHVMMPGGRMLE